MGEKVKPERIKSEAAAAILGVGRRTVQSMALRGELPGAAKIGGLWTFDEAALRNYICERISRPKDTALPGSNGAGLPLQEKKSKRAAQEALQRLLRSK